MSARWSTSTQERWFYLALGLSAAALLWVFRPFFDVVLFAAATVVVAWPVYAAVLARVGGRAYLAAVLVLGSIVGLVLLPLGVLGWWSIQQAVESAQTLLGMLADGTLERTLEPWLRAVPGEQWWTRWLPEGEDPVDLVLVALRELARAVGEGAAQALPGLVGSVVSGVLELFVYGVVVITLFVEGPGWLKVGTELSPLREEYEQRLFTVFRDFTTNAVVGSFVTATMQGLVASIGYAIGGVRQLVLASLLTGVFGFFPIVGTAVVWVPVAIYVGATRGIGWGLFVAGWSLALTGTVDNLVRPFFLRGHSRIHPVAVFLAMLGGFAWLGPSGSLVGPVLLALFLALVTIYRADFARAGDADEE